jgi:transcriptional regulator with XRE-family HTH domain
MPDGIETCFSETENRAGNLGDDKMNSTVDENSPETIRRALSSYEIGRKLRQLRLRKKIALVDLGRHTGLSASLLSQLENGKLIPTLPTLARIAMVFDVSLSYFFGDRKKKHLFGITRREERIKFPDQPGSVKPSYFFENLAFPAQDKAIQAYLAEFPKCSPDEVRPHFHEGSEFLYVFEGTLTIWYDEEEYVLKAGDSAYFDSSEPHSYRGTSRTPVRALVVTVLPRP